MHRMTGRGALPSLGLAAALIALLTLPSAALAQGSYSDARAAPVLPSLLAKGDAGVARPDLHAASLVNPAQLGASWHEKTRVTLLGVTASGRPGRVVDAIEFYEDDLSNIDDLTDEEEEAAEERAIELLDVPLTLRSAALLPSVVFRAGTVGISAGAYVAQTARGQAVPGLLSPTVSIFGQTDGIVAVAAGVPIGDTGARAGLTARYVRRYVAAYSEEVDLYDTPPVFRGSTLALDLGTQYDIAVVPGLTAALTIYDLVGGQMSYETDDLFGAIDEDPDPAAVDAARNLLEENDGPSMRLGLAYEIPRTYMGGLGTSVVYLDWASASTTGETQSVLRKLRLGVETGPRWVRVRAGLGQGYPSFGLGLNGRLIHVDYAFFGRQEGLLPEDGSSYAHALQLRIGW